LEKSIDKTIYLAKPGENGRNRKTYTVKEKNHEKEHKQHG